MSMTAQTINQMIEDFINDKRVSCSVVTIRSYISHINVFRDWCSKNNIVGINQINADVLRTYILYLRNVYTKTATVCSYYSVAKNFVKWLYDWHLIAADYTVNIHMPKIEHSIKVPVTTAEVKAIDDYLMGHFNERRALRNFCMFHLLLDCGFRRQEVINLRPKDIPGDNTIHIVNSKGRKSRIVLLPDFLQQSLLNYMSGSEHDFVFTSYSNRHMCLGNVETMIADISLKAGVRRINPHLLRHTFGTSYCYMGGDINMLQLLMGHSSISTTQIYVHLSVQEQLTGSDIYKLDEIFFKRRF